MTALVILAALVLAAFGFHIGSLSGYVLAMMAGLASACVFAALDWWNVRVAGEGTAEHASPHIRKPAALAASARDGRNHNHLPVVINLLRFFKGHGYPRTLTAAAVLVANFVLTHLAWGTSDPVIVHAAADLLTAGYFILAGQTRWELIIGFLFLASVGVGAATGFNWIPDSTERPNSFFALSHPDILALLGHAANIVLGFGAGDSGQRVRSLFRVRPKLVVARHQAFVTLRRHTWGY